MDDLFRSDAVHPARCVVRGFCLDDGTRFWSPHDCRRVLLCALFGVGVVVACTDFGGERIPELVPILPVGLDFDVFPISRDNQFLCVGYGNAFTG
ncbi:hypothetical protein AW168_35410 [Nocardia brasiliensis]|nr:hypothetical protein AW168_35410 [Nocardia brasiliensis]